ncbi:MAG: AzlC family ABC transporter permease [Actinomycetota bacterium]
MASSRLPIARDAVVDVTPLAVPAVPFGFVVGVAITESAMPAWIAWLTSPLVFAGAAQLTMITLAGTASLWAIFSAVLVINARHVMYSASMSRPFGAQPTWMRWLGPHVMVDQVFALADRARDREPTEFRRYYLTAAGVLFVVWHVAVTAGTFTGDVIPAGWRLDFAPALLFVGMALLAVDRAPAAVAVVVGGGVSLLTSGLRDRLGIVVGAVAGIVAATALEQWQRGRRATDRETVA